MSEKKFLPRVRVPLASEFLRENNPLISPHPIGEEYLSLEEHNHLIAQAKAEAFEEAADEAVCTDAINLQPKRNDCEYAVVRLMQKHKMYMYNASSENLVKDIGNLIAQAKADAFEDAALMLNTCPFETRSAARRVMLEKALELRGDRKDNNDTN